MSQDSKKPDRKKTLGDLRREGYSLQQILALVENQPAQHMRETAHRAQSMQTDPDLQPEN